MTRPWTLRRRLVLGVVALLAVASILIGVISAVALRGALVERLDSQLASVSIRSQGPVGFGPGSTPGESEPESPSGIPQGLVSVGTISMGYYENVVFNPRYFTEDGTQETLTAGQVDALLAVKTDGIPRTVDLGGDIGEYRALAVTTRDGFRTISALPLGQTESLVLQLVLAIGLITVVGIALAALAATIIVRLALRPLDRVAATASQVAELQLDRGEVALSVRVPERDSDPRTEVGQVGSAINQMLGHVASALSARQASEQKVRQFVADASHELRTPLTSIRGYAELTRRSSHELPADVVHSIGRVESEAARMTSLVEDLLLLARLDEGRDLEHESVDLSRLLIDAVSDAHAAGPDHEWALDLPDEPVVVPGDDLRLHQVVTNLLGNARVHTPAGSEITVALATSGTPETGTATITVSDNGPGIAKSLQPELFERFARGDSSRSRLAGSTGLGLAIVKAVVGGHNGRVSVESEPGRTVFAVELPRA